MAPIKKIGFIGYGNMAKAIAKVLLPHTDYSIHAASPNLNNAKTADGLNTYTHNLDILPHTDVLMLCVKPHDMEHLLSEISPHIPKQTVIISIAAGLKLSWFNTRCAPEQAIVRSMPNLPIAIGEGATPLIANQWVTPTQHALVTELFSRTGLMIWTHDETDIDRYTALSGSGPAYVFQFIYALIEGAKQLGLSHELTKQFALQTVAGATHLAQLSPLEVDELISQVTSAKGTTAEALNIFRERGFNDIIAQAMKAAHARAEALNTI